MVLINNLTVDEINAALIHLQRSRNEVVGGEKGDTVQNITINNQGGGADYSSVINAIENRLTVDERNLTDLDSSQRIIASQTAGLQEQVADIYNTLLSMSQNNITDISWDDINRVLVVNTTSQSYEVAIPSETVTLSLEGNVLTFTMGEQTTSVTLNYIPASEKGVAGGVATLDSSGRIPYSQLPESAMEFLGKWDASTNTPHLQDGTGTNGDFYVVSVGGTVNFGTQAEPRNITFYPNDRVVYEGSLDKWFRLPAGEVRTVNGLSGDVVLNGTNVNYDGTNNSPTLKSKIDSVETKAETQADWNISDSTNLAYIKNKPALKPVATSGSYNDLTNKPTIPAAQIQSDWTQTDSTKKDFIKHKIPIWISDNSANDNIGDTGAYCPTAGATQNKVAHMRNFTLVTGCTFPITFKNSNLYNGAITLNVNGTGAKTIYINNLISSTANHTLSAGTYICWYSGSAYYIDRDYAVTRSRLCGGPLNVNSASNFGAVAYTSTAAGTAAKTATCYGYKLIIGQYVKLYVGNTNTVASPTLNIASTGAKSIFVNGVAASTSNLTAGWYDAFYDGTYYQLYSTTTSVLPSSGCAVTHTAAGTQAKVASMPYFKLQSGTTFELVVVNANSYNGKITLNVNGTGAKDVWINGAVSSSSNKTLPAGTYICHYDGSKYLIDTTYAVPSSRGVNEVTSGNMQSVSSNAVYDALKHIEKSVTLAYPNNFEYITNLQVFKVVNNILYINITFHCISAINFSNWTEILFFDKLFTKNVILGCYAGFSPLFCYLNALNSSQAGKNSIVIYPRNFNYGDELSFTLACPIG